MPIRYSVSGDGHFIHAIASDPVTSQEFVEYEVDHAIDNRIRAPVSELLEIETGALRQITKDDILMVMERRKDAATPQTRHRCGIIVSYADAHAWDIAKFYEGMAMLHSPETVIVFGDARIARIWLGVEDGQPRIA